MEYDNEEWYGEGVFMHKFNLEDMDLVGDNCDGDWTKYTSY